jgi:hypothetical protein
MIEVKASSQNDKVMKLINNQPHLFRRGARRGFAINGKLIVSDVVTKMNQKPKGGRSYKVYRGIGGRMLKRPRTHVASSPDDYPAVITGELRKSVDFRVKGYSRMEFGAGNNNVKYAKTLEKRNKYLRRTMKATSNQFKENLNREIRKSMRIK